jgi:WD40 repeat protein
VTSVAFSGDGKRIVSGSDDKTVRVWDAATGEELSVFKATDGVTSVGFDPVGKRVVAASGNVVQVWDIK